MIIAFDGHSSTGKSSLAKEIAKHYHFIHLDSGALYRTITFITILENKSFDELLDENYCIPFLTVKCDDNELSIFYKNQKLESQLRTQEVNSKVSKIASQPRVRDYVTSLIRETLKDKSVVADGRDIGTEVFPNSDLKFFITAKPEIRSKRRFLEVQASGGNSSLESIHQNLMDRDKIDSSREVAPLRVAEDAIFIDNTFLTKEETFILVKSYIDRKIEDISE